jgi:cell division septation protein DedD
VEPASQIYTIQVAAYKQAGDADKLVAKLKRNGFLAYRAIGKVPGKGIWYRVRVGEFKDKSEAGRPMANLKKLGYKPALVEK